jgi:hypothetical protein
MQFSNNRYGTIDGTPAYTSYNNYPITDPMLQSPTQPRPTATSPLRNALNSGASIEDHDVYGQPRDLGGYVDIGAAEYIE